MMDREIGNSGFPIWLLGDSNPPRWEKSLRTPLDPRHPIRHNIWTPVIDIVQDRVFRERSSRVDTSQLYIRNAVEDPTIKPKPAHIEWGKTAEIEVDVLRKLINGNKPQLILCFGAFAFEFARRALSQEPERNFGYWGARRLGEEFRQRINQFHPDFTNSLPLLHRSISGGKFIQSHDYFCAVEGANYFEFVGNNIADKLIEYHNQLPIWIE